MSLTKELCDNWSQWQDDANYLPVDNPGPESGAPPPQEILSQLFGDTRCMAATAGEEFDCNIGDVGLYNYGAARQFQETQDNLITENNTSMTAVYPAIGNVIPDSSPTSNICKSSYKKPLNIDFSKVTDLTQAKISALQKTWGNVRSKQLINGGTHVDNVSLSTMVQGKLVEQAGQAEPGATTINQTCLKLELHGDQWTGDPTGLTIVKEKDSKCPDYRSNSSLGGKKVGACVATEYQLGPGRFEVIAHAPDMAQWLKNNGGDGTASNGYCWAIWTFHYEEHSQGKDDPQSVSQAGNTGDIENGFCFNHVACGENYVENYQNSYQLACTNQDVTLPGKEDGGGSCYGPESEYGKCDYMDTSTTIVNHEIDIEIPGSWPGKTRDIQGSNLNSAFWTPSTWNCNTFLGENDNVMARALWQSQYVVQKMDTIKGKPTRILNGEPNSFLATPPRSQPPNLDTEKLEFHNYRFDWIVPENGDPPYVEWFFDGRSMHKSYTMIPTRSSRLVVGGWFPHWTQSGNSNQVSDENSLVAPWEQANIYVASIKYTPDPDGAPKSKYTDYPQNYDQCGKDGLDPISCGFVVPNMPQQKLGNGTRSDDVRVCNTNCPTKDVDPPPKNDSNKLVMYILIALAVISAIALGILMVVLFRKK
jgi:hypothetical protein